MYDLFKALIVNKIIVIEYEKSLQELRELPIFASKST